MPISRIEPSRRQILQATALGGAAAFLAACGGSSGGKAATSTTGTYTAPGADATGTLKISNWGDPPDKAVYAAVKERFAAKYPKVQVTDNFVPITTWTDYINKLVTDFASGNGPDVINIAIEGMELGMSKNLFLPLTGYLTRDAAGSAPINGDVEPQLLKGLTYDGAQRFLPNTWNTMVIYYNTKLFQKAGLDKPTDDWSWDDFLQAAQKLTTGSGADKIYGFSLPYFNFGLTPWFFSNGTGQFSDDLKTAQFTDPKMVEAVTFISDLVRKHGVAPQPKGADPYQLFQSGKVAMTGAGHWEVAPFKKAGFQDYDVVSWPQKTQKATVYGVSGFGIYSKTKAPDLAWEYLKQLAGPETQKQWVENGGANPALKSAAALPAFTSFPPNAKLFYDSITYGKPVQAPVAFPVVEPALLRALDQVLNGSMTPQAAMGQVQKTVTAAMSS
jgi:multiple sugar transport system substrate-binding protein